MTVLAKIKSRAAHNKRWCPRNADTTICGVVGFAGGEAEKIRVRWAWLRCITIGDEKVLIDPD